MMEPEAQRQKVLGIGDVLVDLLSYISRMPPPGGNAWGTAVQMFPGGGTANVATSLARLGVASAFAGRVGADPYGQFLLEDFEQEGVETSLVRLDERVFTGIVFTLVDETGERTFFPCARGAAHLQLARGDVEAIPYSDFRLLHACGISLVENPARDAIIHALRLARQAGVPTYYDPNLRLEGDVFLDAYREAQWQAIGLADTVMVGEAELALLCNGDNVAAGARQMLERGAELVVVKQGSDGATAFWPGGEASAPAYRVEAVDTSGAGDAWDAGFIAARLRDTPIEAALTYANAVAAIKVTRAGPRAVPSYLEVEVWMAAPGSRSLTSL